MVAPAHSTGATVTFGGVAGASAASISPTDTEILVTSATVDELPLMPILTTVLLEISGGGKSETVQLTSVMPSTYSPPNYVITVNRSTNPQSFSSVATIAYKPSYTLSNAVSIGLPGAQCRVIRSATTGVLYAYDENGNAYAKDINHYMRVGCEDIEEYRAITVTAPMSLSFSDMKCEVPIEIALPAADKKINFFGFIAAIEPSDAKVGELMYETITIQVSSEITVSNITT